MTMNPESTLNVFYCPICHGRTANPPVYRQTASPQALVCGHLFHRHCLEHYWNGGNRYCPQCDKKIKEGEQLALSPATRQDPDFLEELFDAERLLHLKQDDLEQANRREAMLRRELAKSREALQNLIKLPEQQHIVTRSRSGSRSTPASATKKM